MKKKTFDKKLALNKKTVANLDTREMKGLNGGGVWQHSIYQTNCIQCDDLSIVFCISVNAPCPTNAPLMCAGTIDPIHCG